MVEKAEDFSEWYNDIIERADLIDKRYPVKGMDVWRPHGWELMRNLDERTREEMARTGHREVNFPLLIPKDEFQKEGDHIEGFDAEVFWVTKGGTKDLDVPLVVRPTSETAMYPMYKLWVRSHTDLPAKYFQIVNTFRYETKHTRSFIRVREIHFFEAHTCHEDFQTAHEQVREDQEIWARLAEKMCLPYVLAKRPEWDKFPGAFYSIGADVLMPDGRSLQCGTFHHYKENFAEAFDIEYEPDWARLFEDVFEVLNERSIRVEGKPSAEAGPNVEVAHYESSLGDWGIYTEYSDEVPDDVIGDFEERLEFPVVQPPTSGDSDGTITGDDAADVAEAVETVEVTTSEGEEILVPLLPNHRYVHQTTYGMSERLLGAVVGVHGDDQGLILPPDIAPTQVAVVPIVFSDTDAPVLERARDVEEDLRDAGFTVEVDTRDENPGYKFNDWEMKGVPLRIEIGPRDVEDDQAVLVTRHDGGEREVALDDVVDEAQDALEAVADGLTERAEALLEEHTTETEDIETAGEAQGVVRTGWCGEDECGLHIEEETGKDVLGVPVEDEAPVEETYEGSCVRCGKAAEHPVVVSDTY